MSIFLILIITMAIRIGIMDSYINGRRRFIGEESINILVYTLGTAFYMAITLKEINGFNDYLVICPMILVILLYIIFIYFSVTSMGVKKERERKKIFYKVVEYISIGILLLLLPLIMIYPLIDIAIAFLYDFENKEIV